MQREYRVSPRIVAEREGGGFRARVHGVLDRSEVLAEAVGRSKKEAENAAAEAALRRLTA